MKLHAMDAMRFISSSFTDIVIRMCEYFLDFVGAVPEERFELCFFPIVCVNSSSTEKHSCRFSMVLLKFSCSVVLVFVLVEGFEDIGGGVFVLLADFINHSEKLDFVKVPLQWIAEFKIRSVVGNASLKK